MEFVKYDEIRSLLADHGIEEVAESEDTVRLKISDRPGAVHLHISSESCDIEPHEAARKVQVSDDQLPGLVEQILHALHVADVLIVPAGKWRRVFDAVAFSLAENEEWQQIDAAASVELNTRDPLLAQPSDYNTLTVLVGALLSDAEEADQAIFMLTPAAPLLIEVVPLGAIRICLGNGVLADEVAGLVGVEQG